MPLDPVEYRQDVLNLKQKIKRYQPHIVILLGVTIFRMLFSPREQEKGPLHLGATTGNWAERGSFSCRIRAAAITPIARCSRSVEYSVTTWSDRARSTALPPLSLHGSGYSSDSVF